MKVVYSSEHKKHHPVYETYDGVDMEYAEKPERIETIKKHLQAEGHEIVPPVDFGDELITSVHFQRYVDYLRNQSSAIAGTGEIQRGASNHIMDRYTPLTAGTYLAARVAANVALTTAQLVTEGFPAYGLCRPPGHHAAPQVMGGYCYFNNASIAAERLAGDGRVAILDIDYHHGNGTQEIFYERDDVLYVSLHADPEDNFPYTSGREDEVGRGQGLGYNMNIVLPKTTNIQQYLGALAVGIDTIKDFDPKHVVLSLGFDTYIRDPIAALNLEIADYHDIGSRIGEMPQPIVLIQEGGYKIEDLGKLASSFLSGFRR